ncbi:MAG: OmpH family outer membrane protein [Alphaproteobacteria bacterium]|nr:OmpH family outer membrane protein [Alphaproteobacteria bacterium]
MGKRFCHIGLLVFMLFWGGAVVAASAPAPEVKPSIVAIVDVQRILQASKAAKSVQQQLDTQRSKFQTEIAAEETDLRDAEKKLSALRETAKANDYVEQEQKLQQRFLTVEQHVQSRRKSLDQAFTDSMNAVRTALIDIVSEIAKEQGVNLVIVKQQVIWNDQNIDITDEVLTRLDKALPNVQVNIAAEEEKSDKTLPLKPTGPTPGHKKSK